MTLLFSLLVPSAFAVEDFFGKSYYFGDLHAHTGGSGDGASEDLGDCGGGECGNYQDLVTIARDDNGLDFVAVVDHLNGVRAVADSDWSVVFPFVNTENDEAGGFITIPGAEVHFVTADSELGHSSLLLFGDEATLGTATITDLQPNGNATATVADCAAIGTYYDTLVASFGETLILPHHPAANAPMPTDWSCHDQRYAPAVEVYSEHGNSIAYQDSSTGYDPFRSGYATESTVASALDPDGTALRLGFFGGSDNHDTHPGQVCGLDTVRNHPYAGGITVAVLDQSETFSRAAIYDAIVERRTYASSGPQLPATLDYFQSNVNIGGMGDEINFSGPAALTGRVQIPTAYEGAVLSVTFVGPDRSYSATELPAGTWRARLGAAAVPEWLYVDVEIDGDTWWIAIGTCEDGGGDSVEHLWLSPTWFD